MASEVWEYKIFDSLDMYTGECRPCVDTRWILFWYIRNRIHRVSTQGLHESVYQSKLSNIDFVQTKVIKFRLLIAIVQDGALIHFLARTAQCKNTLETLTSVCSSLECDFGTSALPFNPYRCFEAECWAKLAGYRSFKAISEDLHRLRSAPRSRRYSCTRGDGGNGS